MDYLIKRLKQLDIVYRNPVSLKNAGNSDFYIDVKKAYGYPEALNLISENLWGKIDQSATVVAGEGHGGISLATVISTKHNLHLTLIRDEPKDHGKEGYLDGYIPNKEDKIAIIDDVFTTGGSLRKMIKILEPTRAEIIGCYVVVKRGEGELSVPLRYLLTPEDLC